jgi:hypothetical protein
MAIANDQDLTGTVVERLNDVLKSVAKLHTSHEALHKSAASLVLTGKAVSTALKAARKGAGSNDDLAKLVDIHSAALESHRLASLNHKSCHAGHCAAVAKCTSEIAKLLGGGEAEAIAHPATGQEQLPTHLTTSEEIDKGWVNLDGKMNSPFDRLVKSSQTPGRVFKNAHNPHFTG